QREVLRARIVLLADKGKKNQEIAKELGVTQDVVGKWRTRFFHQDKEGLDNKPLPGKPQKFDYGVRLTVIEVACRKPERITHWSTRELAKKVNEGLAIDISHMTVQRILFSVDLKPHQVKMWVNSQDPDFEAKMMDVVGLYVNPPENATTDTDIRNS
ncbi:unnamed protein product, partial [marine sediment metagenome]